jgi:hypothetical protein
MEKNKIKIAAIQETKLTSKSKPKKTPGYTLLRKDRGTNKGGGLAFIIHQDIHFQVEPTPASLENDEFIESLTISIPSNNNRLMIRNVYIPPQSSCNPQYRPNILALTENLNDTSTIVGDLNAHHTLWFSDDTPDQRGTLIVDTIDGTNFGILNEDQPTRVANNCSTAPDLTITSNSLLQTATWNIESALSSDHLPITITLSTEIKTYKSAKRTFINFNKADWEGFTAFTETSFSNAENLTDYLGEYDVHQNEKFFRNILNEATRKYIPAGRIPEVKNAVPTDAARLINIRDSLRKINPNNPQIPEMNRNIQKKIDDHRKNKWREYLDSWEPGSKDHWDTIKGLDDQPRPPDNQAIYFNDRAHNDPKTLASKFNAQYTPNASTLPSKESRPVGRKLRKPPSDTKVTITPKQTQEAIRKAKNSKALGPDGISTLMLKHLGPQAINYLTTIYNNSVNKSIIPTMWKTGRIIPLLKPGKPADQGSSYRPISLLSPVAKTLESILLPEITAAIPFANHQHGFRKGRSTLTALQSISNHITQGLNKKKPVDRTIAVAIDLSKAFDTVNHEILLKDIEELDLNNHIKRFLNAYLRGRQTFVEFRGATSKFRKMKQGVPQGGVLSPVLFNLYMSKMPPPPPGIKVDTYADDTTVLKSGPTPKALYQDLNIYLSVLDSWFKERNLFISPAKSSATLFTTHPHEVKMTLDIKINEDQVPTVSHPKLLGVTFDNTFSFLYHVNNTQTKLQKRNNLLKKLAGSTWGKDHETLNMTYKAIGQSLTNYCSPIWTPNLKQCNWDKLQSAQNSALRIVTGCVQMTPINHLHQECKVMPVKDHNEMLSQQFLLATQKPNHPNYIDLNATPPARQMKETLKSRFGDKISNILPNEGLDDSSYKTKLKEIHTKEVKSSIQQLGDNQILQRPPPNINESEKKLNRKARTTLSQLRSGYSSHLNSFLARINEDIEDVCPDCNEPGHTTEHLFDCKAKPTNLTTESLWNEPMEAANFLGIIDQEPDDYG